MADFVSQQYSPIIISSSGSSSKPIIDHHHDVDHDDLDNACSICLEPFNSQDPSTVTNCRHEYHLQCILEWSQRRTECPICWQILVLKDPDSQELLAAVANERNLRSKRDVHQVLETHDLIHDASPYEEDSDFEARIMRHFAAAARRARFISRRGREVSSPIGPSRALQQTDLSPEHNRSSDESSEGDSASFASITSTNTQCSASLIPGISNVEPQSGGNCDNLTKSSQHMPQSPQRPSSSEFSAFSDSFKSKFSAASTKYKESISKGTRGFKEKLLARNISVKELGKGVQREMSAGIAGVTRMIERLDLASKRNGVSVHLSSCTRGNSNSSSKRTDDMKETIITQHEGENDVENARVVGSAPSSKLEMSPIEGKN